MRMGTGRKFRLGQSREVSDIDLYNYHSRDGRSPGKYRQKVAECFVTNNKIYDSDSMLLLPDYSPWMHLPEATLVWRHSKIVDLELDNGTFLRASLAGKLKGIKLVVGDRLRYESVPAVVGNADLPQTQVVAVMPRRTLLKRGGINDREPWQLICANADELWICVSVANPPLRIGLIERAQALAMSSNLNFRIIVTKCDQSDTSAVSLELAPLLSQGLSILETSVTERYGLEALSMILQNHKAVLVGHSGVGKSSLVNALMPNLNQRIGEMSRYGTGRQTTTGSRWFSWGGDGAIIDTPGIRNLSVRGLSRELLLRLFPEFSVEYIENPIGSNPDSEGMDLISQERMLSLQRLWLEMAERNPNQSMYH